MVEAMKNLALNPNAIPKRNVRAGSPMQHAKRRSASRSGSGKKAREPAQERHPEEEKNEPKPLRALSGRGRTAADGTIECFTEVEKPHRER